MIKLTQFLPLPHFLTTVVNHCGKHGLLIHSNLVFVAERSVFIDHFLSQKRDDISRIPTVLIY